MASFVLRPQRVQLNRLYALPKEQTFFCANDRRNDVMHYAKDWMSVQPSQSIINQYPLVGGLCLYDSMYMSSCFLCTQAKLLTLRGKRRYNKWAIAYFFQI